MCFSKKPNTGPALPKDVTQKTQTPKDAKVKLAEKTKTQKWAKVSDGKDAKPNFCWVRYKRRKTIAELVELTWLSWDQCGTYKLQMNEVRVTKDEDAKVSFQKTQQKDANTVRVRS